MGLEMATRRKMRRVSVQQRAAVQRIHDRRSQDLPINSVVAPITVDDPHGIECGEKIVVFRSLRNDPIGAMHARNQVDEAQYAAARHWQRCYEAVERNGAQAIDTTKEAVDGGRMPDLLTDQWSKANGDLAKAGRALGMEGEAIIRDVLGRCMPLLHAAAARGLSSERDLIYIGRRFKESLDTLALVFGYAMPPRA